MRCSWPAVLLAALLWSLLPAVALAEGEPPEMPGRAAILIDATTGQVLYEQHADERNFPASTTKLLTALLAVENADLNSIVTVSERASGTEGTSCYLRAGEQQPLLDLLRCMLVESGNDAAIAVAEHVSGTQEAFAELMTARAEALGATNSHFTNPHGLYQPDHYTTARDLALIARAAFANPTVRELAGAQKAVLDGVEHREFFNRNRLLWDYDWAVAGKTGFIQQSLYNLVADGERGGIKLVGVLLGFENRNLMFQKMADLLEWGFNQFTTETVVSKGQRFGTVTVARGAAPQVEVVANDDLAVLVPSAGGDLGLQQQVNLAPNLEAPVSAGQHAGELVVKFNGVELGRVDLVTATAVDVYRTKLEIAVRASLPFANRMLAGAAGTALLVVLLRVGLALNRRKRPRGYQIRSYRRDRTL